MSTASHRVSIVLVTYNSARVIDAALAAVPTWAETIVVDNASGDDTVDVVKRRGVRCIQNDKNVGFGAGCNIGAEATVAEHILFLNPDAVLLEDALERLLQAAERYPDAGAFGPALLGEDGTGGFRLESFLHPRPSNVPMAQPAAECCWPFLVGAAFLCRREAFVAIGGFDEGMFLFYEEDDLFLRLRDAGWSIVCVPDAKVKHVPGRSAPPSFAVERLRQFHWIQSHAYVAAKHGLEFNPNEERRSAWKRLFLGVLQCDRLRIGGGLGRIQGLGAMRKQR